MSLASRASVRAASLSLPAIVAVLVGGCSHDWDLLDPALSTGGETAGSSAGGAAGTGAGGTAGTSAAGAAGTSAGGTAGTSAAGAAGNGVGGAAGTSAAGAGGAGPCSGDLTTDPMNCGACGHDCQGGACKNSACQIVTLAANEDNPVGVAIDADEVYWTNYGSGQVRRVSINAANTE